ncbi:MAG TPA: DUF4331 domain-containing protein [Chloroflexia bacterium]|nr:DUF4331 domain-containing protein [Chloroflexia bacterium]
MTKRAIIRLGLLGVLALMVTSFASLFAAPTVTQASSHREAPLISQDPVADATDLYSFVSPDRPDTVTFITNWIPYENPAGGPNFFRFGDDVLYELHIDNVGDAQDHISFAFQFHTVTVNPNTFLYNTGVVGKPDDEQYNQRQYMDIMRYDAPADGSCKNMALANCPTAKQTTIAQNVEVAPANVGPHSFPIYAATAAMNVKEVGNGIRAFAGPRADSFFADIGSLFDLLTIRKLPGNAGGGVNSFAGYNVHTISLQIPINQLTSNGMTPSNPSDPNAVIGSWITSSRRTTKVYSEGKTTSSGQWVQIERLGMPLVNEIVVPLALKDAFNSLHPWQDATIPAVVNVVTDPEPARLLKALYGLNVPPAPRNDILMVFAQGVKGLNQPANVVPSEQLRLNVAIKPSANPNRMGVLGGDLAGFPNGRRLTDDVVDAELQVVAGVLVDGYNKAPGNVLGDGVDAPAGQLMGTFPYQALPYSAYYVNPGKTVNP